MIRGVGRGFISGWWGVVMIVLALGAVMLCCFCWCWGFYDKRRRRLSLAQQADSELTLREDSPKFLKLLANKENVRRHSNINIENQEFKNCVVEYSGSICPYPPENANSARLFSNIPIPLYDG
ncbi:uncharacterized protein LOC110847907 [Folsomia candida]|uniref:Putative uridine kinase DAS2 n=1 Tax=Folsomia candida TaxID=158441 RepID=A0A226EHS8_FOLCA|nr:uncharacterized protein LOC110847907 [Folsomia candida]OXA57253.1 putative uridine kinase DAS2 [Folsomia candida]